MRGRFATLTLLAVSSCFSPNDSDPTEDESSTSQAFDASTGGRSSSSTAGAGVSSTTSRGDSTGNNASGSDTSSESGETGAPGTTGGGASCDSVTPIEGMRCIPGGTFLQGSLPGQGFPSNEQPQRIVELSPYFIDTSEVTVADYTACVNAGECAPPSDASANWGDPARLNHPVDGVAYGDAEAYCTWVDKRLPTEAQWERAARGTRGATFPWGDASLSCDFAHIYEGAEVGCGSGATAEVNSYPLGRSEEDVADLAGNVAEWVADWYGASYYASAPGLDPLGPEVGTLRIYRGGSVQQGPANNQSDQVRAAYRGTRPGEDAGTHIGFRCARGLDDG